MYNDINGIISAMVTPMNADETINYGCIDVLVNHLISKGVKGIFALGTAGEFFSLDIDEKQKVIETTVKAANGRVPVFAGVGGVSTREVIENIKMTEHIGITAYSVVTPYYVPITQAELIRHYERIALCTKLPIILYNIPARTGVNIDASTAGELSRIDNIVGIKDSSGNIALTQAYLDSTDNDFCVLAGNDSLILESLKRGAKGAVAATSNAVPEVAVGIYNNFIQGNIKDAEKYQDLLRPIRETFSLATVPSPIKTATCLMGIDVGPARGPVGKPTYQNYEKIKKIILDYYSDYIIK